ncbi:MAG: hypothetical protein WBA61_16510 [Aequorivita sp.]
MENTTEIEILDDLIKKYPSYVNPNLIYLSISIVNDGVCLNKTFKDSPDKKETEALDFIADDHLIELDPIINPSLFNPLLSLQENAGRFIHELGAYTIATCFDGIFTKAAERRILGGGR